MVSVKIECGCGQHYAFDVEPVNGQMADAVACPTCGTDGTSAANAVIASKLPPTIFPSTASVTAATSAGGTRLKIGSTEHPPAQAPAGVKVDARSLGLVDRATAETEARAKISWGDSKDDVIRYLMLQGFSVPEATELVEVFYRERLAALRAKGVRKIVVGIGLMCVPVIAYLFFAHMGIIPIKLMGMAGVVGLVGCWMALTGTITLLAPKMESGDVTD
jgi:hypothetical protein